MTFKSFMVHMAAKAALTAALILPAAGSVLAQTWNSRSTINLPVLSAGGFYLTLGQTHSIPLPRRLFVHSVLVQVEAQRGHAGGEVMVNGDRKGNFYISPTDPSIQVTVEQETGSIEITSIPAMSAPQGLLIVRSVRAIVSETDASLPTTVTLPHGYPSIYPCIGCDQLPFPLYYQTKMGNISNRAIILVDRLLAYASYEETGRYLLPIKKAAAEARSMAEVREDASGYGRIYYLALLKSLDDAEPYLHQTFGRSSVFGMCSDLLALREYIRETLD